jgi:pimeloyl-ACP methyl ester carboxylesterase
MGWFEYFVRQGRATYVVDQVGRGRSGFNQAIFNQVAAGEVLASSQPRIARMGDDIGAWVNFRIGPIPRQAFPDTQFPVEAIDAVSQRGIPDLNAALPSPNPTYQALTSLSHQLEGVVLLGHSQSGAFPLEVALLDSSKILASVIVEPGSCNGSGWTDEQIKTLAKVPTLILYGDHLSNPTGLPGAGWQERMDDCRVFVERLRANGGNAELWHGPDHGVRGNSHMMMWDKNNLEIAKTILNWLSSVQH